MTETQSDEIRTEAERLAAENMEAEPNISDVYWFPHDEEIRLIEVDPTTVASDVIAPFYFRADPVVGTRHTSGVAIIRPEEVDQLQPPKGWGTWNEAKKIPRRG